MASGRKSKKQEKPAAAAPEQVEVEEEEAEVQAEAEQEDKPETGKEKERKGEARPRRSAKARAPRRSGDATPTRQRVARKTDPRQQGLFTRLKREREVTRTGGSILLSLIIVMCLVGLFHLFATSRFFNLKGVDVVWREMEAGDTQFLSTSDVEEVVRRHETTRRGVLRADLEEIRKELKKDPVIREVEVARLLPDRLRVSIIERHPVALARRSDSSVVCVDDDGIMFGAAKNWRKTPSPPPINGLAESGEDANEVNRHWIAMYKELMAELDQTEPQLSSQIDEIFFDKDAGARLVLINKRGAVLVGKEDFRTRLNVALDILAAIGRKDLDTLNVLRIRDAERLLSEKINYVNVIDPKRPIVGLDE